MDVSNLLFFFFCGGGGVRVFGFVGVTVMATGRMLRLIIEGLPLGAACFL